MPALLTLMFYVAGFVFSYGSEMTEHQGKSKQSLCIPGHALRPVGRT